MSGHSRLGGGGRPVVREEEAEETSHADQEDERVTKEEEAAAAVGLSFRVPCVGEQRFFRNQLRGRSEREEYLDVRCARARTRSD